jgi:predicted aspartyl protease
MALVAGFRPSARVVRIVLTVVVAAMSPVAVRGRADTGTIRNIATVMGTASNTATTGTSNPQDATTTIPFESKRDFLVVVEGTIGGLERLRLLVDTGHHQTTIDSRVARALQLTPSPALLEAFGRRIAAGRVVVPWLKIGPLKSLDLPVLVTDLRHAGPGTGLRADAIVGLDFLRGTCVSIDYRRQILTVGRADAWDFSVAFQPAGRYPIVTLIIDGISYRVLVDTGAEMIALFSRAVSPRGIAFDGVIEGDHLAGRSLLRRFTAETVRLGDLELRRVPVFVAPGGTHLDYDGVIGSRWITSTRLQLDLEWMVLSWDK